MRQQLFYGISTSKIKVYVLNRLNNFEFYDNIIKSLKTFTTWGYGNGDFTADRRRSGA